MTRIYIVRHAEAEGNLYRRCHGQYDSTVTCNGLRQIQALAERFADEMIHACYSSDLVRTKTTAQAVSVPKKLKLRCDARFRELALGVWEDVPFGQLDQLYPAAMTAFNSDPFHWGVEGSEPFAAYTGRFLEALYEAAERHDGETIAIFSHGCVIRGVQQRLFYPPEALHEIGHCDNTGVSLLEYDAGRFRKVYLNDNSHLSEEISTLARQSWWRSGQKPADENLWFRPCADAAWYQACRKDAWETVYGPRKDFDGPAYYRDALRRAAGDPAAICEVLLKERRVGLVQLAPGDAGSAGHVAFLYLLPEMRRRGLGIQLVGHAVSYYRAKGKNRLRLLVSPGNQAALDFYKKFGFSQVGLEGDLLVLELNIDLCRDLKTEKDAEASASAPLVPVP